MHPLAARLLLLLAPPVAASYIRLLGATMHLEKDGWDVVQGFRARRESFVLTFWHGRFLMMPFVARSGPITAMLSRSRDAELLARTLAFFGVDFARGSTSLGGATALRSVVRRAALGSDVAVVPDGPRGPRRRVQPGVIAVARLTGLPILPVTFSASPARRLRSWDRTLVPRPFGRGLFLFGELQRVPRDASRDDEELARQRLERELDRITDLADRRVGLALEEPRLP